MAKLTLRAECSSCLFSHSTSSQSRLSSHRRRRLVRFPPKNNLELRVLCSIKEKESITKRVNGLPVDKVQRTGSGSGSDSERELSQEIGSGEVCFDKDWPPWKNIPQR